MLPASRQSAVHMIAVVSAPAGIGTGLIIAAFISPDRLDATVLLVIGVTIAAWAWGVHRYNDLRRWAEGELIHAGCERRKMQREIDRLKVERDSKQALAAVEAASARVRVKNGGPPLVGLPNSNGHTRDT